MGRFRIRFEDPSKSLGSGATFQVGSLKKNVRNVLNVKFNIFLSEELQHISEVNFIFFILCLALNSVAMLSITQNCTSVDGLRDL